MHRVVLALGSAALLLATSTAGFAQGVRSLSLQDCFHLALENNLEVQVDRFGPEIADFNYGSSKGAYDPAFNFSFRENSNVNPGGTDPLGIVRSYYSETSLYSGGLSGLTSSGMTYSLAPTMTRSNGDLYKNGAEYSGGFLASVSQPLLKNSWIDSARQQLQVSRKNKEISAYALENQIVSVLTRVEQAYYDLIFSRENVKVQVTALELAQKLLDENKKRVEVGAMAPLDEKQAESQVAARKADLLDARRSLETSQNTLRNLLTDDYSNWHTAVLDPTDPLLAMPEEVNLQESWRTGMEKRPDLLQARVDIERQNIILRYQKNQIYPQLDLQASYGHNGLGTDAGSLAEQLQQGRFQRYSVGIVVSIPLYNRTAKNAYQATRAQKMQSLLRLKKQEQDIIVEIDEAVNLVRTQYQRIDATRQARLYAEAALDAEQKKLASGKSTSFVVLQLQRDLTTARSNEIRALADYRKALATLAQSRGTTLERHKLDVQIK